MGIPSWYFIEFVGIYSTVNSIKFRNIRLGLYLKIALINPSPSIKTISKSSKTHKPYQLHFFPFKTYKEIMNRYFLRYEQEILINPVKQLVFISLDTGMCEKQHYHLRKLLIIIVYYKWNVEIFFIFAIWKFWWERKKDHEGHYRSDLILSPFSEDLERTIEIYNTDTSTLSIHHLVSISRLISTNLSRTIYVWVNKLSNLFPINNSRWFWWWSGLSESEGFKCEYCWCFNWFFDVFLVLHENFQCFNNVLKIFLMFCYKFNVFVFF